jgi:hypothetical protein
VTHRAHRSSLLLVLALLASSASAGVVETFNSLLERARSEKKDLFMVVVTPVEGAQPFAELLASEQMKDVYQDRFLAFPILLTGLQKMSPAERTNLAALLELYQAEPGPHPVFVFLRADGVAYHVARPTLSPEGSVDVTLRMMTEFFAEDALKAARQRKAAFGTVVDTMALRPPEVAARELSGLLEKLPGELRRLPEGKHALKTLLSHLEGSTDPSLVALREKWQPLALHDAHQALLWQVRRLAWAANIPSAVNTAEDLCRTSRDPEMQREGCLSGVHLLVSINRPGALSKALELLKLAKEAAVALGERATAPDSVTGLPGASPSQIEDTYRQVDEARARLLGATAKTIQLDGSPEQAVGPPASP